MPSSITSLSSSTIENLCSAWGIKNNSTASLEKKIIHKSSVLPRFMEFSSELMIIVYHLVFSFEDVEQISTRQLIQKCALKLKKTSENNFNTSFIEDTGFVYVQKKRAKLSAIDDTIILLPEIKEILKESFCQNEDDFASLEHKKAYNKKIYSEFTDEVVALYSLGSFINIDSGFEKNYNKMLDSDFRLYHEYSSYQGSIEKILLNIEKLIEGNILSINFIRDVDNGSIKAYLSISNSNIIDEIEAKLNKIPKNASYTGNHKNILYDLDLFIDKILMGAEKKSCTKGISKRHLDVVESDIFSNKVNYLYLYHLSQAIKIIDFDRDEIINKDQIKRFKSISLSERIGFILNNIFIDSSYQNILGIIKEQTCQKGGHPSLSIYKLLRIVNDKASSVITYSEMFNIILNFYVLGLVLIYEEGNNIYIEIASAELETEKTKFMTVGTFDFIFINHSYFSDEFIYLCMLFSEIQKQDDNTYAMSITENSVVDGKTLSLHDKEYNFEVFIDMLIDYLGKYDYTLGGHTESAIRRWYNKSYLTKICDNAILIEVDNIDKTDEVLHGIKKLHINVKKLGPAYLIISNDDKSKNKIVKFLSKNKINIDFVDFDDIF